MDNEPLNPLYTKVFTDHEKNGTPNNIKQAGCLALAQLGKEAWNAWRSEYPVRGEYPDYENIADFSKVDFSKTPVNFDGFIFGDKAIFFDAKFGVITQGRRAEFNEAQFGVDTDFTGAQFGEFAQFKGARFGSGTEFTDAQFGYMPDFEKAHFGSRVSFKGAIFGEKANFIEAQFDFDATFEHAQFKDNAWFTDTTFGINAQFMGTQFGNQAQFDGARFDKDAGFLGAQFGDNASFMCAQFDGEAQFMGAQFGSEAKFTGTRFKESVYFSGAQFRNDARFDGAKFDNNAKFIGVNWDYLHYAFCESKLKPKDLRHVFCPLRLQIAKDWAEQHGLSPDTFKSISFAGATFKGQVDFSGRTFTGVTSFGRLADIVKTFNYTSDGQRVKKELPKGQPVKFGKPPLFHGCKLHQDTTFDGAIFPDPSADLTENDIAARAYRTLKLALSQHQATREEKLFFRLEMREEARRESQCARRLLFRLYSFFSDYGFSVSRPFVWLVVIPLLVTVPIYGWLAGFTPYFLWQTECQIRYDLLQFSLIQALPLPGLDKWSDTLRQCLFPTASGAWQGIMLTGILMLHKALSLLAVFLMGLALRNLFKMK
jgi:hypothetical protein